MSDDISWRSAGDDGSLFISECRKRPGWYWLLRPHHEGPSRYDPTTPVACPVYVFAHGGISSPLADFRSLDPEQVAPRDLRGGRYPSFFAGPMVAGPSSGSLRVERMESGHRVEGAVPEVPGWYWCRTNPEAPLVHVDEQEVGPIYLDRAPDRTVHVWSAATLDGRPIDVGELGFSEPLTSDGGIIDASGELERLFVEFFGQIPLPPKTPEVDWIVGSQSQNAPSSRETSPPRFEAGEAEVRVADLQRSLAFYRKLGFQRVDGNAEAGWATLLAGGLRLRLTTSGSSALRFAAPAGTEETLKQLGFSSSADRGELVLTDPDGNVLVVRPREA